MHKLTGLLLTLSLVALAAGCGGGNGEQAPPPDEDAAEAAADAAPEAAPDAAPDAAARDAADAAATAGLPRSPAPPDARVFFVTPGDGDVVESPVHVEFGIESMDVVPAGTEAEMGGHHHVIIDSELPPMNAPIPADDNHVHFGDGATETDLELEPGEHTLQLLFADHLHVPHDPPVASERITVTVE